MRPSICGRVDMGERAVADDREVDQSGCPRTSIRLDALDFVRLDVQRFEELCAGHTTTVAARCLESNQYGAYHATLPFLLPQSGTPRNCLLTPRTNAPTPPPTVLAMSTAGA